MKLFAQLIHQLDSTNKQTAKTQAIQQFLAAATDIDKLWLLSLFTGKKPKRPVSSTLLKQWVMEVTQIPEWLFVESYAAVGDLGETIALLLPPPSYNTDKPLHQWMEEIIQLQKATEDQKRAFVLQSWTELQSAERFIFNKLIGGSFRVGVSAKGLINAIAQYYQLDETAVAHSFMGNWDRNMVDFDGLIHGAYTNTNLSKPYPFCLAYPLDEEGTTLTPLEDWQVEYKWDGIRGQIIKRQGEIFIWSRGEELITHQFPELVEAIAKLDGDFVIDGEILAIKNKEVLNFTELQKRLQRKTISKKLLQDIPVGFFAYDILEFQGEELKALRLNQRRKLLEKVIQTQEHDIIQLSQLITITSLEELSEVRASARNVNSEGLMLKHKLSPYHTGRKKGDWWKWKIDPLTIDAVLIYAQKGSGRRSAYYTDYTFAIRDGAKLVTIAKAYSGLTDKEIQEVSKFVNKNAVEKFGPVRTVKPELVFEIAFEGIGFSSRHKSGIALRFPRIARWRKDKTVHDIDDIDSVTQLIN
jgi:DNA ligase-1